MIVSIIVLVRSVIYGKRKNGNASKEKCFKVLFKFQKRIFKTNQDITGEPKE